MFRNTISMPSFFDQKQKKLNMLSKYSTKAPLACFESPSKSIDNTQTYLVNTNSFALNTCSEVDEIKKENHRLKPSLSQSSISDEKPSIFFVAEFLKLNIKLTLRNLPAEQVF